jgi:hypothetical protein
MTVMDEGRMLLNGQGQDHDSSGLNNIDIKVEVEVREQESHASVIVERVFCFASIILFSSHKLQSHNIVYFCHTTRN